MRPTRASVGVVGFLALIFFFRDFVVSGFDRIPGGRVDARFLIVILEHWYHVLLHGAPMSSPPFFAPARGVLGYSESMALFAPPYIGCRVLGLDRYLAFTASLVAVKTLGFASMYLMLRRVLEVDRFAATVGAALFTVSNACWLTMGHAQLMTVSFVPALALLVHRWVRTRATWTLPAAALLLAIMLFTSFYIGWFTVFLGGILCGVIGLAAAGGGWGWRPQVFARGEPLRMLRHGLGALAVFAVAVLPLLSVYLPALARTGGRPTEEVSLYLPYPTDAWNVGVENRVWGPLLAGPTTQPLRFLFAHFEAERGWPPVTLVVFLTTLAVAACRVRSRREGDGRWALFAGIAGTTAVAGWLATLRIGDGALWWWVYRLVPGATAIRVPVRLNLVLNVLVVTVVALGLSRLARWGAAGCVVAALFAVALVAEQWNVRPVSTLSRAEERATFAAVRPPPPECRHFYVTSDLGSEARFEFDLMRQIDAMFLAQKYRIRTINGYSGSHPPGWDLDTRLPDYEERARRWAAARGIARGLCRLELATGRWSTVLARR